MKETSYSFLVCKTPDEMKLVQDAEMALLEGLGNNIYEHLGSVELGKPIKIIFQDQSRKVMGGVIADCFGGWVYISLLWVDKSLRNLGFGTQLMQMVETEAIQLGCSHAHLDTFSFEARPFYDRLGYELFATLNDYPPGHNKYFLKKSLTRS